MAEECPPCKIIIDGRALQSSAIHFAAFTEAGSGLPTLSSAARYLAAIAGGSTEALSFGIKSGALGTETIDEAHAMSELSCHRAAWLRHATTEPRMTKEEQGRTANLLMAWAEELRLHATRLIGGEYRGPWKVDGITGISRA